MTRSEVLAIWLKLMNNRLNEVEEILQWKVHVGNNNNKNLSSTLIMYLCYKPWQLIKLDGPTYALQKRCQRFYNSTWDATEQPRLQGKVVLLSPIQHQYFNPYSNQDNEENYRLCTELGSTKHSDLSLLPVNSSLLSSLFPLQKFLNLSHIWRKNTCHIWEENSPLSLQKYWKESTFMHPWFHWSIWKIFSPCSV